ncbi:DUF6318 family protein [Promicromonospora aerolata]|uniref:DUF6318 family protein n=1 Tax=Promicromonospora aerolata TaxID=195749 RepID=A0ABW4V9I7_9MICO
MRVAGLVVGVGLALSACTGPPDAEPSPSGEPTSAAPAPGPSSSPPGPAKPERPDAMKRKDAKGAAAAAEYYLSLYSYTKATGDTEEWNTMSHRACSFCKTVSERAKEIKANGESFTGGKLATEVLDEYVRDDLTGIFPLDIQITQAAYTTRSSSGKVIDESKRATDIRRIEMGRQDGAWVVVTVAPVPGAES